jgi:hypothetical protein
MSRRIIRPATMAGALGAMVAILAVAVGGTAKGEPISIEVAEIGSRYVTDPDQVDEAGLPTRGNFFVTEGYIYPAGTLTCSEGVCDGVVYDEAGIPSPEFPDQVIGTWTCYGAWVEDAATTMSGPNVVTTQIYDMGSAPGADSIVTTGLELVDLDAPVSRAIVGGTGEHAGASGVQTQRLLGLNSGDVVIDDVPQWGVGLAVELAVS